MELECRQWYYEATYNQPILPRTIIPGRKDAVVLGHFDVEYFERDTSSRHNRLEIDHEQQTKARRRRIYESEYNRPYPSRKKIQLWTDPRHGDNYGTTTTSATTPASILAESTPLPIKKFNRGWICNNAACVEGCTSPHDELEADLSPRELWRSACGAVPSCSSPNDGDIIPDAPLDESMICTPRRKRDCSDQNLNEPAIDKNKRPSCRTSERGSSNAIAMTPGSYKSEMRGSAGSVFAQSTPESDTMCAMGGRVESCIPNAPLNRACGALVDPAAAFRARSKSIIPAEDEGTTVEYPEHEHDESHRSLHQFFKNTKEDTLKLYIDDYQESVFDRIVESLYGNSNLKTIAISRSQDLHLGSRRTRSEMTCLFQAIRCLPNIKTLLIWNAQADILPAMVENIPSSLARLRLHILKGGVSNNFLDALATKDNLRNIQLEIQESMEIGRLVQRSNICTIKVSGIAYRLDSLHMLDLANQVSSNFDTSLKTLDLHAMLDLKSWNYLTNALRFNTTLQKLKISFYGNPLKEQDEAAKELAELLHSNTTLTHITNYAHESLVLSEEMSNGILLDALLSNVALQHFTFFREDPVFGEAKDALLKRNLDNSDKDEVSNIFYQQYLSFASSLPTIKSNLCGRC